MNGVAGEGRRKEEEVQHLFRVTRMEEENELWPVANKLQQLEKVEGRRAGIGGVKTMPQGAACARTYVYLLDTQTSNTNVEARIWA